MTSARFIMFLSSEVFWSNRTKLAFSPFGGSVVILMQFCSSWMGNLGERSECVQPNGLSLKLSASWYHLPSQAIFRNISVAQQLRCRWRWHEHAELFMWPVVECLLNKLFKTWKPMYTKVTWSCLGRPDLEIFLTLPESTKSPWNAALHQSVFSLWQQIARGH